MEYIFIAFMLFAAVICLFAVVMVVIEHAKDRRAQREVMKAEAQPVAAHEATEGVTADGYRYVVVVAPNAQAAAEMVAPAAPVAAEPAPVEAPVEEPAVEEAVEAPAETEGNDANGVWINRNNEKTHLEKYAELSAEMRARYDEIKAYALMQKDVTARLGNRYEDFRNGKKQVVRMVIRREVLHCEFVILHSDLNNYIVENHVSVKHAPTAIKIDSDEAVTAAKNSIDIAMKAIEEEREFRAEQQKKRRREARARRAAAAAGATTETE